MTMELTTGSGFLSESPRAFREHVHAAYQPWVEVLYAINDHANALQHAIQIHRTELAEACAAVLYARTIASVQASVILLEHGLPTQARTVLRAALETLFPLCALVKKPDLAAQFVASHDADRRTIADRIRRWNDPALRSSISGQVSDADLDEMLASRAKSINQYDLAKQAGMEDWYLTVYTLLSFAAHGAMSDLDSHAVVDAAGNVVEFKNEPELADQQAVWAWAAEAELAAMRSLAELFSLAITDIEALTVRLKQVADAG